MDVSETLASSSLGVNTMIQLDERAALYPRECTEIVAGTDYTALYEKFHNTSVSTTDLATPNGNAASVKIAYGSDAGTISAEFGTPALVDLGSNPASVTTVTATGSVLMPIRLSLTCAVPSGTQTHEAYYTPQNIMEYFKFCIRNNLLITMRTS